MTNSREIPDDLIEIGQLRAPYGLKGWLWLYSETDPIDNIFDYAPWLVKAGDSYRPVKIKSWRPQGKGLVVLLDHIEDRTEAEKLVGQSLYISHSVLPAPAEDEYYWSDLEGLDVRGIDEEHPDQTPLLGKVSHLFETGAHAIMVVQPSAGSVDDQERLIPWHKDTVLRVDMPSKTIYTAWGIDY